MSSITRGEHWERSNLYLFGIHCLPRAWLFSTWPLISPERASRVDAAFRITRRIVMEIPRTSETPRGEMDCANAWSRAAP